MSESCYLIRGCSAEISLPSDCVGSANGTRGSAGKAKAALRLQAVVVF